MGLPTIIRPSVHRGYDLTGGPLNYVIPVGEVWEFLCFEIHNGTAATNFIVDIDGRPMLWGPCGGADTVFRFGGDPTYCCVSDKQEKPIERFITVKAYENQTVSIYTEDNVGDVLIWYRVHTLESGLTSRSDGATHGMHRLLCTWGREVQAIGAGATLDFQIATSMNPPGCHDFPWNVNAPAQRDFELLYFMIRCTDVVGTNLNLDQVRVVHQGRELIREAGILTPTGAYNEKGMLTPDCAFPIPPYIVQQFDNLQVLAQVTSTDVAEQDATVTCAFWMLEHELKEVHP